MWIFNYPCTFLCVNRKYLFIVAWNYDIICCPMALFWGQLGKLIKRQKHKGFRSNVPWTLWWELLYKGFSHGRVFAQFHRQFPAYGIPSESIISLYIQTYQVAICHFENGDLWTHMSLSRIPGYILEVFFMFLKKIKII